MPKRKSLLLISLCLFSALTAWGKPPPEKDYLTHQSENFRVHYELALEPFARRVNKHLEEMFPLVTADLKWDHSSKIDVFIHSYNDHPNGSAAVFPNDVITIRAVPFQTFSTLGEYDDWIRILAIHELTHIIGNNTTRGFFSVARAIFGSTAKINRFQPRWLVEGLAVYQETLLSQWGRGRSVFTDMLLRTASTHQLFTGDDNRLGITIDRFHNGVDYWPGYAVPYLLGYVMTEMLAVKGGKTAPGEVSYLNGGRLPIVIDWSARDVTQSNFVELWKDAQTRINHAAQEDLKKIRQDSVTSYDVISQDGRWSSAPVFVDDHQVYFVRDSARTGRGLNRIDLKTKKETEVVELEGVRPSLRASGDFLAYARNDRFDHYSVLSDIYLWDWKSEHEYRLTEGFRAHDPDFSPDFKFAHQKILAGSIVYIKTLEDANQAVVIWDGKKEVILHRAKDFERLSFPAWGRKKLSRWIAFSEKRLGRPERLLAVNTKTKSLKTLVQLASGVGTNVTTPSWTSDGRLLYSSTQTGVMNLYQYRWDEKSGARITNFETGALYPAQNKNNLLAVVYGKQGFQVAEVKSGQFSRKLKLRPFRQKLSGFKDLIRQSPKGEAKFKEDVYTASDYSAFPSIVPKYWRIDGSRVTDGWVVGASTHGEDVIQRFGLRGSISYDTRANFIPYRASLNYDGLYPTISLVRQQKNLYLGLIRRSNRVVSTGLSFQYPIDHLLVSLAGTMQTSRFIDEETNTGGLYASFSYRDMTSYADSIEPEKGTSASLGFTGYLLGDDQFYSANFGFEQRVPTFNRHFVRFKLDAGYSSNDRLSAKYYVGGGEETVSLSGRFLLRGYPQGVIFGRRIVTTSLEYWLPVFYLNRGPGTWPIFFEGIKMRAFVDSGSAEYVNQERTGLKKWPIGTGIHLMTDMRFVYRFPVTITLGFNYGLQTDIGGQAQFAFGLSAPI